MKLKKFVIFSILLILCNQLTAYSVYRKAPGISLLNRNGNFTTLAGLNRNKNIILSFWATYCVPCKAEMPRLAELENKYAAAKNLRLVFISIDGESEKDAALAMLNGMGINSECLFDIYQVTAKKYIPDLKIPASFLIDRNGYIVFEMRGGREEDLASLEKAIQSLK